MVTIWEAIKQLLFCDHELEWLRNVQDSNLRTGHKHPSSIYVCRKCGRFKTLEHM